MGIVRKVGSNVFNISKNIATRNKRKQERYAKAYRKAYAIKNTREEQMREARRKQIQKISEKDRLRGYVLKIREARRNRRIDKAMKKGLPTHGSKRSFL